jgi:WD40 repeat protein
MANEFQRLASFWRRAEFPNDSLAIADALWLAQFLPLTPEIGTGGPKPDVPDLPSAISNKTPPSPEPSTPKPPRPSKPDTDLTDLSAGQATTPSGKTMPASRVNVAAAAALPNPLVLSRALRPFSRRYPSRSRLEFDEEMTVEQTIRNWRRPSPHYRPLPERWFDVALICEESPSMSIWRRTIHEFRLLLERQGSFRDVRVWRLQPGGKLFDRSSPRRWTAVGDPTGRRLILVVSDCVSAEWYNGTIGSLLLEWGRHTPVAIIHVLPPNTWAHTAIGEPSSVLRSPRSGLAAARLKVEHGWWTPEATQTSITLPVVPLDPAKVLDWARMSMAMGGSSYPGVTLSAVPLTTAFGSDTIAAAPKAQLAVDSFRAMVSPEAFELAGYLAAAPLTLPVMRLVQQSMFGDRARQFHLAEFFLGGLIRKERDANDPEEITFDFHTGVRAILADSLRRADAFEVIRRVSQFISERIGQPLDWKALMPDARGQEQLPMEALPFARIAREILGPGRWQRSGASGGATFSVEAEEETEDDPPPQQRLEKVLRGHSERVTSVVIASKNGLPAIVSAGNDGLLRVWDLATGILLLTASCDPETVLSVVRNAERPLVYGGGADGMFRTWDIATGRMTMERLGEGGITAVCGSRIVGLSTGQIYNEDGIEPNSPHKSAIRGILEIPDDSVAFISASDEEVTVWEIGGQTSFVGKLRPRALAGYRRANELIVAIAGAEGSVFLWSPRRGQPSGAMLEQPPATSLACIQSGGTNYLISASTDGQLRVWNLETNRLAAAPFGLHDGRINSLFVDELGDSGWLAVTAGDDTTVRITDLRPFLTPRRSIMMWTLGGGRDLPGMIYGALKDAGHTVHDWDRSQQSRDLLPSCDHVVVVVTEPLQADIWNPYEEVLMCRDFFVLAVGLRSEVPKGVSPRAVQIDFRNEYVYEEPLKELVKIIESAPPVRVAAVQELPFAVARNLERREVKADLKRMLQQADGPSLIYLVSPDPQEAYDLACSVAIDCDVRRAFSGGIHGAHSSLPVLTDVSAQNRALLIVTKSSLMDGAAQSPMPNVCVLVTDSGFYPEGAATFEIPAVSLVEIKAYLQTRGLSRIMSIPGSLLTSFFRTSALLRQVSEIALVTPEDRFSLSSLVQLPDFQDELIAMALDSLNEAEKESTGRLTALRDRDWAPRALVYAIAPLFARLELLGIVESSLTSSAVRLHASARRRLPAASTSAHALVISFYTSNGSRRIEQVPWDGYFERNIEYHLAQAGAGDGAVRLLGELSWLKRKLVSGGIRRLLFELSTLHAIESINHLNEVLGASAGLLENNPEELPAALLRYMTPFGDPLARLQAYALTDLSPAYRSPSWFVLVAGSGTIVNNVVAYNAAVQVGRELARNGFGLITGGWSGVDEVVARSYLEERTRLGFSDSMAALLQIVDNTSGAVVREGGVIQPDGDAQQEAVRRAAAVILIEGLGGTKEAGRIARGQNKPVFPLAGTGGDAKEIFEEMVNGKRFSADDPIGREMNAELTQGPVRSVMYRLVLLSRRSVRLDVTDPSIPVRAQEYLDLRASQPSSGERTRQMEKFFDRIQEQASAIAAGKVTEYVRSVDRGIRLEGYARAWAEPDPAFLGDLVAALTEYEDTPFGQYWCLRATLASVRHLPGLKVSVSDFSRLRDFAPKLTDAPDRGALLQGILSIIEPAVKLDRPEAI